MGGNAKAGKNRSGPAAAKVRRSPPTLLESFSVFPVGRDVQVSHNSSGSDPDFQSLWCFNARKSRSGIAFDARQLLGPGGAAPLGCAGAASAVSGRQLRRCGNTNKVCCSGPDPI